MHILIAIITYFSFLFSDYDGVQKNPATQQLELRILSESEEIAMGEQQFAVWKKRNDKKRPVPPMIQQYVQQVGESIAKVSDRPHLPYEFVVVDDPTPNAYCYSGGKIVIHTGMLRVISSETELAALLAHEIAHANLRHGAKKIERELFLGGIFNNANNALAFTSRSTDRKCELEADAYGIKYMHAAGYDPQGAIALQETFNRINPSRASWLAIPATHPAPAERIAANRITAMNFPAGGKNGENTYKIMTERLKKKQKLSGAK